MRSESETDYADSWNIIFKYETTVLVNCILNAVFMLTSVLENSLVLAAILRTPSLRSPSIIFLCSLASSDLFVGLVVQPVYIAYHLTESTTVYQVLSIMAGSGCGFSLLVMTAITVDRFLALHYPMQYPNLVTAHRAFSISASCYHCVCFGKWKLTTSLQLLVLPFAFFFHLPVTCESIGLFKSISFKFTSSI